MHTDSWNIIGNREHRRGCNTILKHGVTMRVLSSWQMTGCHYLSVTVTGVTPSAARGRRRGPWVSHRITRWCCYKSVRECLECWVRISSSDPCHLRSHLSRHWAPRQEAVCQIWGMKLLDNIQQMLPVLKRTCPMSQTRHWHYLLEIASMIDISWRSLAFTEWKLITPKRATECWIGE